MIHVKLTNKYDLAMKCGYWRQILINKELIFTIS